MEESPLLCARCSCTLTRGSGELFLVRIVGVADPTPQEIPDALTIDEIQAELRQIYRQLEGVSATEARNEVYRALLLTMCGRCYRAWFEDPAGSAYTES
ncbi:MAG: hypothetical protein U0136_07650 [Bdellovibrionota bacterium]